MLAFTTYSFKVLVISSVFYGYYYCFLRKGKFYDWNRFYLLASTVLSLLIPLLKLPFVFPSESLRAIQESPIFNVQLEELYIKGYVGGDIPEEWMFAAIYLLIAVLVLISALSAVVRLHRDKKNKPYELIGGVKVYSINSFSAPFAFFNTVFWDKRISIDSENGQQIFQHELAHLHGRHYLDVMFMELACAVLWVNPLFWLIKRELKLVHEFIADKASVRDGDASKLSMLILQSLYPDHYLKFGHQFIQSPIKRRLTMLSKNTKSPFAGFRKLMILPLAVILFIACSSEIEKNKSIQDGLKADEVAIDNKTYKVSKDENTGVITIESEDYKGQIMLKTNKENPQKSDNADERITLTPLKDPQDPTPLHLTDVKPEYPGGMAKFYEFISDNYNVPEIGHLTEARIYVSFMVEEDGSITDIKVLRDVGYGTGKEALRVLSLMPKWKPGEQDGKKVRVSYQLPIVLQIM